MPTLTDLLRRELLDARRGGHRAVASALRSTLAALANAEAVPATGPTPGDDPAYAEAMRVATGGSTEADRRELSEADRVAVVRAEVAELEDAARTYADLDPARAAAAGEGAGVLQRVLAEHAG